MEKRVGSYLWDGPPSRPRALQGCLVPLREAFERWGAIPVAVVDRTVDFGLLGIMESLKSDNLRIMSANCNSSAHELLPHCGGSLCAPFAPSLTSVRARGAADERYMRFWKFP